MTNPSFACVACGGLVAAGDAAAHQCHTTERPLRVLLVDPISADVVRLLPASKPEAWTDVAFTDDPPGRSLTFCGAIVRQFGRSGQVQPDVTLFDLVDAAHRSDPK